MNRKFTAEKLFRVPDGTLVSPFLNSKDSKSDLPFDLIEGFSIAMGKIEAHTNSLIHIHPHITQVTYVLSGGINLKMKGEKDLEPYEVEVKENQAGISNPGELFQLINPYNEDAVVLYIVSPAFVFELKDNEVIYNDAITLNESWEELKNQKFSIHKLKDPRYSLTARNESLQRLLKNK